MSISQYTLHELFDLTDNRYWKLHWFEELTLNQRTKEPLIEALFVPFVRGDLDVDRNPPELLDNASYDFSESKKIEVSAGLLPMLHIGLLLHQGRPTKRPRYQRKVFKLLIGENTTKILPVKHARKLGKWVYDISHQEYQLSGTNHYVRCLHIEVPKGRHDRITKLIIPCAELIRCHYGNSSQLFQEIMTNGLAGSPNRIFDPSQTVFPSNKEGKTPFIQLSPWVKKKDAPIAARFAFSPYALSQGKHIHLSAQINSTRPYNGQGDEPQGRVPEAYLPYVNQQTRLVVHGKVIESGKDRYFLVFYIESDSAVFPFNYFEFQQDGDDGLHVITDQNLPDAGRSVLEESEEVVTVNDEAEELIIRSDKEPSPDKEQVEELMCEDKFPDLNKKHWRQCDKVGSRRRPPRQEPIFIQGHDEIKEFSTAPDGSGGGKVAPISFMFDFEVAKEVIERTPSIEDQDKIPSDKTKEKGSSHITEHGEALPASYDLFKQLIYLLDEVMPEKMRCEFVKIPKVGDEVELKRVRSEFPIELGGWSVVTHDRETRARHVVAARGLCHGDRYFYLLEIEPPEKEQPDDKQQKTGRGRKHHKKIRTYTLLLVHNGEPFFSDLRAINLRAVLAVCAKNKGSWLRRKQLEEFGRYKFKHTSKSGKVFVARIIEYLVKVGLLPLEKTEIAQLLQRLKSAKGKEPAPAEQTWQNNERLKGEASQTDKDKAAEIKILTESDESSVTSLYG